MFRKPDTKGRPVLQLKWGSMDVFLEAASLLILLLSVVLILTEWSALPETVPTHFNANGVADAFGSKQTFWMMIAIPAATYLMLTWLARTPSIFNFPVKITEYNAAYQYRLALRLLRWVKLAIVGSFGWILYQAIEAAKAQTLVLDPTFPIYFMVSILIPIGGYLYLARQPHPETRQS